MSVSELIEILKTFPEDNVIKDTDLIYTVQYSLPFLYATLSIVAQWSPCDLRL